MNDVTAPDLANNTGSSKKRGWGKRVAFGCVGCFTLILLAVGSCAGFIALKKGKYDPIAIPYIEEALPDLTTWEPLRFEQHFAREVLEGTGHDKIARMFNWYSILGPLQSFDKPEFRRISKTLGVPYPSVLTYSVEAQFERGPALITFNLVPVAEGEFRVWGVSINSDALIPDGSVPPSPLQKNSVENPSV